MTIATNTIKGVKFCMKGSTVAKCLRRAPEASFEVTCKKTECGMEWNNMEYGIWNRICSALSLQ